MATLNIKNMPDALYRKLQKRAKQQRRSLAQEVTQILAEAVEGGRTYSILELQGLGKAIWEGIDAAKHVDGERRSWEPTAARPRSIGRRAQVRTAAIQRRG